MDDYQVMVSKNGGNLRKWRESRSTFDVPCIAEIGVVQQLRKLSCLHPDGNMRLAYMSTGPASSDMPSFPRLADRHP